MIPVDCKIDEIRTDGSLRKMTEDLEAFVQLGSDALEIPPHGLDLIINGRLSTNRAKEVRKILMDFPFAYSVYAPNPINLMEKTRGEIHFSPLWANMEFACLIGATTVVYHAGRYVPQELSAVLHTTECPDSKEKRVMLDRELESLCLLAEGFP